MDEVVRRGRRRERTRRYAVAGAAVAAAAVVTAGAVVARPGDTAPEPAGVVPVSNPLPLPWWGDGTLHLAEVTVPAPDLVDLATVGDAVAWGSEDGDVVLVRPDGQRSTVGHKVAEAPMAGGSAEGWLAWVDPRDQAPQLVVYDVAAGEELGRVDLPYRGERWQRLDGGSYPISVDDGRVFYTTQDGDWSWAPGDDEPRRESPADVDLLDVSAGRRISHQWVAGTGWRETLQVTRPEIDILYTYRGGGGWFSPDAEHLAVWGDGGLQVFPFGDATPLDLQVPRAMDDAWDARLAFADDHTAVVTTGGRRLPQPTEPFDGIMRVGYDTWDVSTCDLGTGACTTIEDLTTDAPPVLPD